MYANNSKRSSDSDFEVSTIWRVTKCGFAVERMVFKQIEWLKMNKSSIN